MNNKDLQEQRMKGYFIQATKDILKSEGLKSISVRNIASQAGYSYATLYNYFKDVKGLIFECVKDFQSECEEFVSAKVVGLPGGIGRLRGIVKAYLEYFTEYPGIFELFFIERLSDVSANPQTTGLISSFLSRLCAEDWELCIQQTIFGREEAEIKQAELRYFTTGLLLFYLNRRDPDSYCQFQEQADLHLKNILGS